jgi:hypothetical protein
LNGKNFSKAAQDNQTRTNPLFIGLKRKYAAAGQSGRQHKNFPKLLLICCLGVLLALFGCCLSPSFGVELTWQKWVIAMCQQGGIL